MNNKNLVAEKFLSSAGTYDQHAVAQKESAKLLIQALKKLNNNWDRVLEIGCGTGILTRSIVKEFVPKTYYLNDLSLELCQISSNFCGSGSEYQLLPGDAETVSLPSNLDLCVSSSTLQWFDNLGLFLQKIKALLSSKGYLGISVYSAGTMAELSSLTGDGLNYCTYNKLVNKVSENYEIIYSVETSQTLFFDSLIDIIHHIKFTGVGGIEKSKKYDRKTLNLLEKSYTEQFATVDGFPVTYNTTTIVAKNK
ncbi:MAG: methyltransferase domain-containing protein [Desulfotalea sp.]